MGWIWPLGYEPLMSALNTREFLILCWAAELALGLLWGSHHPQDISWAGRAEGHFAVEFLLTTRITLGKRSGSSWKGSLSWAGRAARGGQAWWQKPSPGARKLSGRPQSCARKEDPSLSTLQVPQAARETTLANVEGGERGRCLPVGRGLPLPPPQAHVLTAGWAG